MRKTKDITKREGRGTKGNGKITSLGYRKGITIAYEYQIITIIRLGLLNGGELACHMVSGTLIRIPSGVMGLNHVSTSKRWKGFGPRILVGALSSSMLSCRTRGTPI
ncbi:unnamed protein product [Prunus armeniaca]